ncbi:MAG: hypothetical protein ABIQ31_15670 [Ferruginibacter sp.]
MLITDLLDFSRIERNVELKEIDCNIMMRNMPDDIMVAIEDK